MTAVAALIDEGDEGGEDAVTTVDVVGVPDHVASAIREVYDRTHGERLAAEIVEAARDENSPLHGYFDWNNTRAAEAYRLIQAEMLVRRVKVKIIQSADPVPVKVRAYIAARDLPAPFGGAAPTGTFRDITEVAGDATAEAAIEESIKRDLARLSRKYAHVQTFWRVAHDWLTPMQDES